MKGLLLRLSELDSDAASAVRVIGFYDAMLTRHTTLDRLVASTAALAECPAGLSAPDLGVWLRLDAGGKALPATPPPAHSRSMADGGRVWLERTGPALPLDAIVLERFSIAASLLLGDNGNRLSTLDDVALVELAVSASAGEAERSRALHLLGIAPLTPLRVLAVKDGPLEPAPGPQAAVGSLHAVLSVDEFTPPPGLVMGIGPELPAMAAAESWRAATVAARFAHPGVVDAVPADQLGGLVMIAEKIRPADIAGIADVAALDRLAAEPGGREVLDVLHAVSVSESVRKAAVRVHRHHSSVLARLARAEAVLGFEPHSPTGRFRLMLALALRQIRDSAT